MALDPVTEMQKAIIRKGEMVVADLAPNGVLPVQQFREFVVISILKGGVMMKRIRVVEMTNPTYEVPKIRAQDQVLHGSTSGVALTEDQRSKPSILPKTVLTSKLLRGAVPIPDEVFEDNVEREALNAKVRDMTAEAVARDLENLLINGDTTSSNTLLNQTDGVLKLTTTNVVPAGGTYLNKSILRDTCLVLPDEFREEESAMVFFTSHRAGIWYRDSISNRTGDLGDTTLTNGDRDAQPRYAFYNGSPIIPVPLIRNNKGSSQNETNILYCNPKNILFGIQRDVRMEYQRDQASSTNIIHVTCRVDVGVEYEQRNVLTTGVKAA